jgi:hypothetical protein
LLIAALVAGVLYLRHNSHARKVARRREREMLFRDERDSNS